MKKLTIYTETTKEYQNLKYVAEYLSQKAIENDINAIFKVKNTYLDYGQNWKWTNIICYYGKNYQESFQFLYPTEFEIIVSSPNITTDNIKEQCVQEMIDFFEKRKELYNG